MTDKMKDLPTIYTATTPTELREAVVDLCFLALAMNDWHDGHFGKVLDATELADAVVPPVPQSWRVVTVSGHSYRYADGVLQYRQGNGEWAASEWVHAKHFNVIADLIANPMVAQ